MDTDADIYKTYKIRLKDILKNKDDSKMNILTDACVRTHKIITHTYQFINLYALDCYHKNIEIPVFDENIIKMCFKTFSLKSAGPKPKGENLKTFNKFVDFHKLVYCPEKLIHIPAENLSSILSYSAPFSV